MIFRSFSEILLLEKSLKGTILVLKKLSVTIFKFWGSFRVFKVLNTLYWLNSKLNLFNSKKKM